jgi:hypothetical protein
MRYVKNNGVEGVILGKAVRSPFFFYSKKERFSPSLREVALFETEFQRAYSDSLSLNGCARQYAGYINERTKHRCIMVVFACDGEKKRFHWKREPVVVIDGGLIIFSFDLVTQTFKQIST